MVTADALPGKQMVSSSRSGVRPFIRGIIGLALAVSLAMNQYFEAGAKKVKFEGAGDEPAPYKCVLQWE